MHKRPDQLPDRVEIAEGLCLLKVKGKFLPYRGRNPVRGYNKKGHLVWRSYRSVEEAKLNLRITED